MLSRARILKRVSRARCRARHLNQIWRYSVYNPSQKRHLGDDTKPRPKTIFSGIQPTGIPHLGNYLGALQRWVRLQDEADPDTTLTYSLVDLHAITIRQEPQQLRQWRKESLAMLLAIGLDPKRSTVFYQSDAPAHVELMWILSCQASTGYLSRMTQWKDKTAGETRENSERLKLGLFSYPVLQAADVLVHRATHVPVGHDQAQHLEFTRELAVGFNHVFGQGILTTPETMISPAKRIMSLTDPTTKMSKSHPNPKSRILLTDSEKDIQAKIKGAITDSEGSITYDPENRPGVSNLIDIMYHSSPENEAFEDQQALARSMDGTSMRGFKDAVAQAVEATLRPIRERYQSISEREVREAADIGRERARTSAGRVLKDVKEAVGLTTRP